MASFILYLPQWKYTSMPKNLTISVTQLHSNTENVVSWSLSFKLEHMRFWKEVTFESLVCTSQC